MVAIFAGILFFAKKNDHESRLELSELYFHSIFPALLKNAFEAGHPFFYVLGSIKNIGDQWISQDGLLVLKNKVFRIHPLRKTTGIVDLDPAFVNRNIVTFRGYLRSIE